MSGTTDQVPSKGGLKRHLSLLEDVVCFGDDICLYCEDSKGFVYNHQTGPVHNALNIFNGQENRDHPKGVLDPYSIQFTIIPKINSKETKRHPGTEAAKNEEEANEAEIERQQGRKLRYGWTIQLKHKFTGKFLHASKTQTSERDKNYMKVFLSDQNAKHAQFRIMPKYKVKSAEDIVQVNDQVVLESIKTHGQYLHASSSWRVSRLITGSELNLGVSPSSFTVMRSKPAKSIEPGVLQAGALIRLLHKETNAYLAAQGIAKREPAENVHMRGKKPAARPSSSAVTYWTVEAESSFTYGDVLHWKQHVRLRHMTTLRYLMVMSNGNLALTDDPTDPLTVFKFHPVMETGKEVEIETYTWLQHVLSETWIHADQMLYLRKELKEHAGRRRSLRENLRWDEAPLKMVTSVKDRNYDDAFTIQHVNETLTDFYRYAVGMVPGIQDWVLCSEEKIPLTRQQVNAGIKTLEELTQWMYHKGSPSKPRQKLLRDLGIVDLLVELLIEEGQEANSRLLLCEAYQVLETFVKGDCRKNELYVCKYLEFFTEQFSVQNDLGKRATEMMTELIKDNRKVIDRLKKEEISAFIDLIKQQKNYRFLSLLGELCVCDGVALPDNQIFIAKKWLGEDRRGVLLTEVGTNIKSDPDTVYVSKDNGRHWIPIQDYCGVKNADGLVSSDNDDYSFLVNQLDLFGKLCVGRNHHCIKMITEDLEYLTWEEAFMCLKDERLPDGLRARYCGLITGMFVDVGNNRSVLDQLNLSFIYSDIGKTDILQKNADDMPVANKEKFPEISKWLNQFFNDNKYMVASQRGKNKLIEQVLRLVYNLITYGYYSNTKDIRNLLGPLMSLLDGENDRADLIGPAGGLLGLRGNLVEHSEYNRDDRFQKSPQNKDVVGAKYSAMEVVDLVMDIEGKIRLEKFLALFKKDAGKAEKSLRSLHNLMTSTAFFKEEETTKILLDLANYNYSKMGIKAMGLMNKYYSAYENLFNEAVQAQVLIKEESKIVHSSLLSRLPELRRLLSVRIHPDQVNQVCETLNTLTGWCHLKDEPDEPHPINQQILVNNGVLDIIFNLMQQKLDIDLMTNQYKGFRQVLKSTLVLLKYLGKKNKHVQTLVFDSFDFLIDIQGTEKELGEALLEIFTGNQDTCQRINSNQIWNVMQRAATLKENASEFLDLLCAIVKIEELDMALKRNQTHVMRALMKNYHDVAYILEKPQDYRHLILRKGKENSAELSYLMSLIDLLACCAEGENPYIESQCQKILPVDEVINTLNDKDIDDNLKRPYLRFLLWAFLRTGVPAWESGTVDLPERTLPWKREFLQHLPKVTVWVKANKDKTKKLLKKAPPKSDVPETVQDKMFATLHFIFEAALPYLKEEYQQAGSFDQPSEEQVAITKALAKAIREFSRVVGPQVATDTQLNNLHETVTTLSESQQTDTMDQRGELPTILSEEREKYIDDYEKESTLNNRVNDYAVKMAKLYKGDNTVSAQLPNMAKNHRPYCENTEAERLPLGREFQKMVKQFILENPNEENPKYSRVKILIQQIMYSSTKLKAQEQSKAEQVALDIKCLQVMRALIHNQERQLPKTKGKHKMARFKGHLEEIARIQKEFNDYDAIVKTMPLLNRTQRGVTGQYLAFLGTMFLNAAESSQEAMGDYFWGTRDELFFHNCRNLFQTSITAIKEQRVLQERRETLHATFGARGNKANAAGREIQKEGRKMKMEAYMNGGFKIAETSFAIINTVGGYTEQVESTYIDEFNIQLLLEMLAAMCDGQNKILQDYLRDQTDNIKTVNLVGEVVKYFHTLYSRIDKHNIHLVIQLLTTLNEFCSGNSDNTQVAFDHDLIDYLNYILRQLDLQQKIKNEKLVIKLHDIISNLLMSMVEEDHPSTAKLTNELRRAIDVKNIRRLSVYFYQESRDRKSDEMKTNGVTKDELLGVGFKYHFIAERLSDIRPVPISGGKNEQAAFTHYEDNSMSVEVMTEKGLQKIRFRVRDRNALREEVKEELKYSVKRTSPSAKLRDLLDWSEDILDDIGYQRSIRENKLVDFAIRNWKWLNWIVIFLSLAINIVMISFWRAKGALGKTDLTNLSTLPNSILTPVPVTPWWYKYVLLSVGSVHNVFSLVVVLTYFYSNRPSRPSLKSLKSRMKLRCLRCWNKVKRKPTGDGAQQPAKEKPRKSHLRPKLISFSSLYYMAFLVFSICGTFFYGYFFAFHLLNIVSRSNLLQRVIRAVTQNGKSLLLVGLLGIFVLYIFTLVAFALMRQSMDPNGEQTLFCTTLFECMITIIRFGLLGELFEFMRPHELSLNFVTFAWAAIFHVAFFIIVITIGLNIVFGIILESFSELREAKRMAESDMNSTCFICNRNSFEFEKQAQGFKHHVRYDHNMWAYLFLRIKLNETEEVDFTTIEKHVYAQMKEMKITFFPLGQALCLANTEDDAVQTQITQILETLSRLVKKQEAQEKEKLRLEEEAKQGDWERKHRDEAPRHSEHEEMREETDVPLRLNFLLQDIDGND